MFDLCVSQTGKLVDGSMPNLYTMPLPPPTHLSQAGSDAAAGSSSAKGNSTTCPEQLHSRGKPGEES